MELVEMIAFLVILASICFVALPASTAGELPKIAVWDLKPREVNPSYAKELTSILVSEVAKLKRYEVFDKVLLLMGRSIGGLFLFVKGYFAPKNRGWRCGWIRHVDRWPLL